MRKFLNKILHPKSILCPACGGYKWKCKPALGGSNYLKCSTCSKVYYQVGSSPRALVADDGIDWETAGK